MISTGENTNKIPTLAHYLSIYNIQASQQASQHRALSKYHFWFFQEKVKRGEEERTWWGKFPGGALQTTRRAIKNEYPFTTGDYPLYFASRSNNNGAWCKTRLERHPVRMNGRRLRFRCIEKKMGCNYAPAIARGSTHSLGLLELIVLTASQFSVQVWYSICVWLLRAASDKDWYVHALWKVEN